MIAAKRQQTRNEIITSRTSGFGKNTLMAKRQQTQKDIKIWRDRLEYWQEEFQQFERIVQLQLNEKKRYVLAQDQYFHPLRKAIEEELLALLESLDFIEKRLQLTQNNPSELSNIAAQRWRRLGYQLLNFEADVREKKKNFLTMLYQTLPIGII